MPVFQQIKTTVTKLAAISIRGRRGGLAVSRIKKSRVCIDDFFQEIPQFYKVIGVRALRKRLEKKSTNQSSSNGLNNPRPESYSQSKNQPALVKKFY